MARTVWHLEHRDEATKTLCNREATHRYRFTSIENINDGLPPYINVCPRCRTRAERLGLLQPVPPVVRSVDEPVDFDVSSGDKQHDDWLSRLGVG